MHVLSWPAAGQILKNPAIQVYKTNEINYIQEARNRSAQRLWGYLVMGSGRRSLTFVGLKVPFLDFTYKIGLKLWTFFDFILSWS